MNDRIPLYPGRVKMTPVAGQANTYDMVRADDPTQAGTPLNKASLLKDATAALYGLTSSAVPDDIFAAIGKYKQYWWRRRVPAGIRYVENLTDVTATEENSSISYRGTTVQVATSVSFNLDTGEDIALVNPETITLSGWDSNAAGVEQISKITGKAPCYLKIIGVGNLFYLPAGSNTTTFSDGTGTMQVRYQTSNKSVYFGHSDSVAVIAKVVGTKLTNAPPGPWQYIQSSNRSAYPDSGTQDGYEYEYLGIPFDNAVTAPKIETGSYVGTGTYGASNPNTLTFGFIPKFVWIYGFKRSDAWYDAGDVTKVPFGIIPEGDFGRHFPPCNTTESSNTAYAKRVGTTLSWYNTKSAGAQLNYGSGAVYYYFAIG